MHAYMGWWKYTLPLYGYQDSLANLITQFIMHVRTCINTISIILQGCRKHVRKFDDAL